MRLFSLCSCFMIFLFFVSCASVKVANSPLGDDKYLITCDGNGYASTGDTLQCLAKEASNICSPLGKKFKFLNSNTESQSYMGINLANGNPVPQTRPHSAAEIQCY